MRWRKLKIVNYKLIMTEIYIQEQVINILKGKYSIVRDEVPVLTRCADIIYKNNKNELISIEIKLTNWKKASEQAKDHLLVVDRAYICMPEPKQKQQLIKKIGAYITNERIGLLFYSEINGKKKLNQVKKAEKNNKYWAPSRNLLEKYLYA
jgi:hypothetical protein